jgi:hypothetical protein
MRNTQVVRNTLRELDRVKFGAMYTNKYTNCRTVKVYCSNRDSDDAVREVRAALPAELEATVKFIPSTLFYGGPRPIGALIVRLPL